MHTVSQWRLKIDLRTRETGGFVVLNHFTHHMSEFPLKLRATEWLEGAMALHRAMWELRIMVSLLVGEG